VRKQGLRWVRNYLATWLASILVANCSEALGLTLSVQELAMGEVALSGPSLASWNYAYNAQIDGSNNGAKSRSVSIPLGLLRLTRTDFSSDAEPISLVNLLLAPPWHMQLDDASSWIEDVQLELDGDRLSMEWEECSDLLKQRSQATDNRLHASIPIISDYKGSGFDLHLLARPSFETRIAYQVEDEAHAFLLGQNDVVADGLYRADAGARVRSYVAINPGATYKVQIGDESSFIVGFSPGLYFGIYRREWEWAFELEAGEGLIVDSDSHTVNSTLDISTSKHSGLGLGFDLGAAYQHSRFNIGVGVQNLSASVLWFDSQLSHYSVDALEGSGIAYSEDAPDEIGHSHDSLPVVITGNAKFQNEDWSLGTRVQVLQTQRTIGIGYEFRRSSIAYRCGLQLDERNYLLPSIGIGMNLNQSQGFDIAFAGKSMAHGNMGILVGVGLTFK
jgi:hypothetical protein